MNIKYISFVLAFAIGLASCKKENIKNVNEKGNFILEFENLVNNAPLVLETKEYINANGDSFNVSTFKYYVSNIALVKSDGTSYKLPESYILVDAAQPRSSLNELADIPVGDYTGISFIIGVDKDRNFAGAQTGALDPILGMFWTWNSGYIFVKMEGTSPQSTAANHTLTFHIGGVADPNNTIRTFHSDFTTGNPLRIRADRKPQIHFKVDLASMFKGKQIVSFGDLNFTMGGANSVKVANNYVNGLFQLDHIHN